MQPMHSLHVPLLNPYLHSHGQGNATSIHSQNLGPVQLSNTLDRGKGVINVVTVDPPTLASLDLVIIHTQTLAHTLAQPLSQLTHSLRQTACLPIFPTAHYPLIRTQAHSNPVSILPPPPFQVATDMSFSNPMLSTGPFRPSAPLIHSIPPPPRKSNPPSPHKTRYHPYPLKSQSPSPRPYCPPSPIPTTAYSFPGALSPLPLNHLTTLQGRSRYLSQIPWSFLILI